MATQSRFGAFERLSSREKAMVLGLGVGVMAVAILVGSLIVSSVLDELEEEIAINEGFLTEIVLAKEPYLAAKARVDAARTEVANNRMLSLRIPINNIARGVQMPSGKKLSDEIGSLDKQVETPIGSLDIKKPSKDKKRNRGEPEEGDVVKVEQDFEFRNIAMSAMYEFLEGIKESDLLFVTRLEMKRKFGGVFDHAQMAMVTVTTFRTHGEL